VVTTLNPGADRTTRRERRTHRAINLLTGQEVAVKPLSGVSIRDGIPDGLVTELREIFPTWHALAHPRLLPLLGYTVADEGVSLVSPWCRKGDLRQLLGQTQTSDGLTYLKLLSEIAEGLAFLHSQDPPIPHGGVKHENVLINEEGNAMLGETGVARFCERVGTVRYGKAEDVRHLPPEFLETGEHTVEGDMYSFGCLSLEVLTGHPPYSHLPNLGTVVRAVSKGQHPWPEDELAIKNPTFDLLWQCLQSDPSKRPSAEAIVAKYGGGDTSIMPLTVPER